MTFTLQRFNLGRVLAPVVLVWAVICAASAGVESYQDRLCPKIFSRIFRR